MTARFVYPFAFLLRQHDLSRRARAFHIRDGAATLEIVTALAGFHYEYGGLLLNYPPLPGQDADRVMKVPVEAGPGDLITTISRPSIHPEHETNEKKRADLACTDLENLVIRAWEPFFELLIRPEMTLDAALHDELLPGYEDRRHVAFHQLEGSRYKDFGRKKYTGKPRTAAFLLRRKELWPGGPGYLGIFGMDGTTTLVWAYLLRMRLRALLEEPGFAMAELCMGAIPKRTPNLDFAQGCDVEVILRHRL